MQISSAGQTNSMARVASAAVKFKETLEKIGSALDSGDVTAAKDALTQLQENPPRRANGNDPLSSKLNALSKAINAGDLKAAQQAYADVKKALSNGRGRGPSGPPPSGGAPPRHSGPSQTSNPTQDSSTSNSYDVRDTNTDGKVSWAEELAYVQSQAEKTQQNGTTGAKNIDGTAPLDVLV